MVFFVYSIAILDNEVPLPSNIPVITSNIDICQEISKLLGNVILFDHNNTDMNMHTLEPAIQAAGNCEISHYFYAEQTLHKEVELLNR